MLTLAVDTSRGRHRFTVLADAFKDLTPVLREFDKYKRGKISELFASQGRGEWPERSQRSEERGWQSALEQADRAPNQVLKKLRREYGRALWRSADRGEGKSNAVARCAFVVAEFERQMADGRLDVSSFTHEDRRLQKSVRGLEGRLDRARARAQRAGQTLGKLPQTIRSTIRQGLLTIDSAWDSPAPLALQEGGKVGQGAELPPRPFLFWEDSDVEFLALLLKERGLLAARS